MKFQQKQGKIVSLLKSQDMNSIKKVRFAFYSFLVFGLFVRAQDWRAEDVLNRSIAYHDPEGNWSTFAGKMTIEMATPKGSLRTTKLELRFADQYFKSTVVQEGITTTSEWNQGDCQHWYEGKKQFSTAIAEKYRLNCQRTQKMRDYYTYLYGLPMKLKDSGAQLHPEVKQVLFQNERFLRLRVDYDAAVGTDRWYFYMDPITFQLRHYQFYHNETENDGEYILLSDEMIVEGIKMPKVRAWYRNKDNAYLGTDTLVQ